MKQNKTWFTQNHTSNPGSVNATDQTERSWQPDEQRRKDNIKLKQLSLARYNVWTLQQTSKLDQLTKKAAALLTDIIAVQEHRMVTKQDIDTMKSANGEFFFIYATTTKQKVGGVRILIRNKHLPFFLLSEKISDRIIEAYFAGYPLVTILQLMHQLTLQLQMTKKSFTTTFLKKLKVNLTQHHDSAQRFQCSDRW